MSSKVQFCNRPVTKVGGSLFVDPCPVKGMVSICLPNLNNRDFLDERISTIANQTYKNWELIISDDNSTDGAWEFFQERVGQDSRLRLFRGPQCGMYPNWNAAIQRCRGEFVYIATSDDTMKPNCLDELVKLHHSHPDIGAAQCGLEIIDSLSNPAPLPQQWVNYTLGMYDRSLVEEDNFRKAPYSGVLVPFLFTHCTSITQLLLKRRVFDRIGLFDEHWGSMGDFEWQMRLGLLEDVAFTSDLLATWRIHERQATKECHDLPSRRAMRVMVTSAFKKAKQIDPTLLPKLSVRSLRLPLEIDTIEIEYRDSKSRLKTIACLLFNALRFPNATRIWLSHWLSNNRWDFWKCDLRYAMLERLLDRHCVEKPVRQEFQAKPQHQ